MKCDQKCDQSATNLNAPRKPRKLPKTRRGEGSYWWDEQRRQVVHQFRHDGKSYRVRGATVGDVDAERESRLADLAEAEARRVKLGEGADVTVAQLLEEWMAFDTSGAPSTLDRFAASAEKLTAHLGDRRVCELTVAEIERTYVMLTATLGRSSLTKVRGHFAMAVEFGVRRGYTNANVVRSTRLPKSARPPKAPTWLDRDGFAAMRRHLAATPSTVNTALLTILLAGLRGGEVLGLRWDHVDLDAAQIAVQSGLQGQRGKRVYKVVDTLKTEASRRVVEIPSDLVAALRRERVAQTHRRLAALTWTDTSLVFTTGTGNYIHPANLRRACTAACRAIEIEPVSPHKLRHTNASILLDAGLSTPATARVLGHVDGRMVTSTYGHALDDIVPTAALLERLIVTA